MKTIAVALVALFCVVGMTTAYYGAPVASSGGFGSLMPLLLCFLLFPLLFNKSSGGTTTFIHGNFSAPTGK